MSAPTRIFGWAADNTGPGWYRLRVPLSELARHGYETSVSTTMPESALEEADVIVGQRVCQPGATKRWERLAAGHYGRRPMLVFEIDDDLWDIDPTNAPAWNFYRRSPELLDNLTMCARLADVCTVTTEPLAEVVRKINPNVVILPNQLPPEAFFQHNPSPSGDGVLSGRFTVGWTGGASHSADVAEIQSPLRQFFRRSPGSEFHNVGTLFTTTAAAVPAGLLRITKWNDDLPAYYRAIDFTVGLAPLRPSPFNQSKSELKFLEYSARGAVTVATNHGPYARTMPEAGCGFLVDRTHEWGSTLRALYTTPSIVEDEAWEARRYAETRRIEKHWQEWEAVYLN